MLFFASSLTNRLMFSVLMFSKTKKHIFLCKAKNILVWLAFWHALWQFLYKKPLRHYGRYAMFRDTFLFSYLQKSDLSKPTEQQDI